MGPQTRLKRTVELKALRICVSVLLLLACAPLFYMIFLGFWWVAHHPLDGPPWRFIVVMVPGALIVLNAVGTMVSLRHAALFALAVAVFYLSWTLNIYPFPGRLSFDFRWTLIVTPALTSLNVVWMVLSLRRRGFAIKEQFRMAAQAMVFYVAALVAVLGWARPYGPDNLPAASIFWLAAMVIVVLNLAWTIQSCRRYKQATASLALV